MWQEERLPGPITLSLKGFVECSQEPSLQGDLHPRSTLTENRPEDMTPQPLAGIRLYITLQHLDTLCNFALGSN